MVAPTPKVSNTDNTETKKKIEPKKETKIVSKKSKTIDKEKIETLLNEIGKVYADSKNFKHKNNYYCKFAFSGTKVTITRTDMGGSRDFTFKHTFDLADIKSISHINNGLVSIKVKKRTSVEEKPKVTIQTNVPFELTIKWGDHQTVQQIKSGTQTL